MQSCILGTTCAQGDAAAMPEFTSLEQTKWVDEVRLREWELRLKERELNRGWLSPLVVAILGAVVTAFGGMVVAYENGRAERQTQRVKAEAELIAVLIKTEPQQAVNNLRLILAAGIAEDGRRRDSLEKYLKHLKPEESPGLPQSASATTQKLSDTTAHGN